MSKNKICNGVGYFVIEDLEDGLQKFYIEEDYGSNTYGDVGLFYRNTLVDNNGNPAICYMATVPDGIISADDPNFSDYAYRYDDVLDICKGDEVLAEFVLELAIGQSIEAIYDEVKDVRTIPGRD